MCRGCSSKRVTSNKHSNPTHIFQEIIEKNSLDFSWDAVGQPQGLISEEKYIVTNYRIKETLKRSGKISQ